ncbi:MAG: hypothetical protein IT236_04480 [Bacteroidia bacterium]|nr:hypothetical protein [Bacteroidia bacterium]
MKRIKLFLTLIILTGFALKSQNYTSPSKQKLSGITINLDDQTIKTQMFNQNPKINLDNSKTYLWYSSQKIMETKGGFDGKLLHGSYSCFYLNNQLKEKGQLKCGLKCKEWKYWYSDGKLREVITWKNGEKNGYYALYNDYGQLMAKGTFKNDKLNGKFYTYSNNGSLLEKKHYKNGEEILPKIKSVKPEPKPKQINTNEQPDKGSGQTPDKPLKKKRLKKKTKESAPADGTKKATTT